MATDLQITERVQQELQWDPSVHDDGIAVAARHGVVTLSGSVDSYAGEINAVLAAERVDGVKSVADDLIVVLPADSVRSDGDLRHAVVTALAWNVHLRHRCIGVQVESGWVTLDGELAWEYERRAALRCVRELAGVRGVRNFIRLAGGVSATDAQDHIRAALQRQAELEASDIDVHVSFGRAILRGTVHSALARRLAEHAAWAAPGVSSVKDYILLGHGSHGHS